MAQGIKLARQYPKDAMILVNLSGRGDKDMPAVAAHLGVALT